MMAIVVHVPPAYLDVYRFIRDMDEARFQLVLEALEDPEQGRSRIAERLSAVLDEDLDDEDFFEALSRLSQYGEEAGLSTADVALGIALDLTQGNSDKANLGHRIEQLLTSKSVAVLSHAQSVLEAQEHLLVSTRVLTTMRPLFGEELDALEGAVTYHELCLEYLDASRNRGRFIVGLDSDQSHLLRQALDRAEHKSASVSAMLGSAQVPHCVLRMGEQG